MALITTQTDTPSLCPGKVPILSSIRDWFIFPESSPDRGAWCEHCYNEYKSIGYVRPSVRENFKVPVRCTAPNNSNFVKTGFIIMGIRISLTKPLSIERFPRNIWNNDKLEIKLNIGERFNILVEDLERVKHTVILRNL